MEIWAEADGAGPTLVFIHAAVADSRMWDPQIAFFARTHRVVTVDLRGYGHTGLEPGSYTHSHDVARVLDRMAVDRAVLIGASLGGRVVLDFVLSHPDRVDGLVLVSSALPGFKWSSEVVEYGQAEDDAIERSDVAAAVELNLEFWLDGRGGEPSSLSPERRSAVGAMQRKAIEHVVNAKLESSEELAVPDLVERLDEIREPAMVIVGDQDVNDMRTIAGILEQQIQDAEFHLIPGAAHLPSFEKPDHFNDLLNDFLLKHGL